MNTCYGHHAEQAATAIARLVGREAMPATPHARTVSLGARDIIISTLRDRMRNQFATQVRNNDPRAGNKVTSFSLQTEPLVELAYVLGRFPRLRPEDRRAPTDVLNRIGDPVAADWVLAARNLMVADHALATAEKRPWLTEPAAHAALACDTAQLVEAIAVMDERLSSAGALAGHIATDTTVDPSADAEASVSQLGMARLVSSTVDRLASWAADHTVIDPAHTAPPRPPEHAYPVNLVQEPGDIAGAQLRLETFLSPMATRNVGMPYRLAATTANLIALNQTVLLANLRERILHSPDLTGELARIDRLMDLFGTAIRNIRGLHDNTGPRDQPRIRGQQQEISGAVRKGHIGLLTDRETTRLLGATESALSTWGAAVRREALRKTTSLRVGRRGTIDHPIYGRVRNDGPAATALLALAEVASSTPEPTQEIGTPGRGALRSTLTQTPLHETGADWPGPIRRHEHRTTPSRQQAGAGPRR